MVVSNSCDLRRASCRAGRSRSVVVHAAKVQQDAGACRLITAIKTPYKSNGKFDIDAYDRHCQSQIDNGVGGVIVGGTTGEGHLMSWDEHVMLIAHTAATFGDKLVVVGNTGSNSTREALHATEQGFIVGMDAALQINPYYGKTSPDGLMKHFQMVLNEGPGIVYNVPGRTGQDIPDKVIDSLVSVPNFLGVKECTGNPRIKRHSDNGIKCWSGNDDEAYDARHSNGGFGVISVTSNLVPSLFSQLMQDECDPELNAKLQDLISWLFSQPNPIPLDTAMMMCGLCEPVFRLPYVPMSKEEREKGAPLLRAVQEHIPGCKEVQVLEDSDFTFTANF